MTRVIDMWNNLPYQVINAQSIIEFKNNLDIFWAEKYMDITRGQWPTNFNYNLL